MIERILKNKIIKIGIRYLLPAILLYIIFNRLDFSDVIEVLSKADIRYLLLGVLGVVIQFSAYTLRWEMALQMLGIEYGFIKSFRIYMSNFFAGTIIPGTMGGFLKVINVSLDGWPPEKGFLSVIVEKIYEVFFTSFFAILLILLLPTRSHIQTNGWLNLSVIIVLAFIVFYISRHRLITIIYKLFTKNNRANQLLSNQGAKNILKEIEFLMSINNTVSLISVSLFVRLGEAIAFYYLARSISAGISFIDSLLFSAVIAVITSLPLSFSGIGTRDAALILLLGNIGISNEKALAFSVLILLSILLMRLVGLVCWVIDPRKSKEAYKGNI